MQIRRRLSRILLFAQLLLVLLIVRNWFYVTTYRLYVDDRIEQTIAAGSAWQQFNMQGKTILPQIVAGGPVAGNRRQDGLEVGRF